MAWSDPAGSAYESKRLVKSGASRLFMLVGFNAGPGSRWLQVFNSTTEPSAGAAPLLSVPVDPSMTFSLDIPRSLQGSFSTGIYVAVSAAGASYAADATASFWINAETD